jgi:hypothetical protein
MLCWKTELSRALYSRASDRGPLLSWTACGRFQGLLPAWQLLYLVCCRKMYVLVSLWLVSFLVPHAPINIRAVYCQLKHCHVCQAAPASIIDDWQA